MVDKLITELSAAILEIDKDINTDKVNPTKPKRYFRNRIKCKKCGDIIESKTRHDFVQCSCKSCFVDGGHDYRRIGGDLTDIEDLGEWVNALPIR